MATINSAVKDVNGKTIDDYKAAYWAAKAAGDAAGMKAANDAANAIRASQGVAAEDASVSIANTAAQASASGSSSGGYTPLNANNYWSATDEDMENRYLGQVQAQNEYIANNPTAVQAMTKTEFNDLYGDVDSVSGLIDSGGMVYTWEEAQAAMAQGLTVTATTYNGKSGWRISDRRQDRTVQEGTSGADEGLINNDQAYAAIQYEKQVYANAQAAYKAALNAGDTALAAQYKAAMEQAHLNAERIRAAWGYSGGADGSMYIDYTTQAYAGNMPTYTDSAKALLDSKGIDYTLPSWEQTENGGTSANTPAGTGTGTGGTVSGGGTGSSSGGTSGIPLLTVPEAESLKSHINDYSSYIEEMQKAALEAQLTALKNAYEKNVNTLDRTQSNIGTAYQDARNQTAGASEMARRNFAQYAAANGLNSGTGGQAELARNVTLQNDLNSINTQEAQSIADLELQRSNLETEYNNAIVQAQAEGDYQLAQALYQEKVRVDNAMISAIQQEYQNALSKYQLEYQQVRDIVSDNQWEQQFTFQQQQWADQLAQQNYENAFNQQQYSDSLALSQQQYQQSMQNAQKESLAAYGELYLKNGVMPSTDMLAAMGISETMAQAYINSLNGVGSTAGTTGTTGGLVSGIIQTPNTSGTETPKVGYDNGSLTAAQVKQLQNYYGLTADGYWGPNSQSTTGMSADDAWTLYQVDTTLASMRASGASWSEVRAAARKAKNAGLISEAQCADLERKYMSAG